MFSFFKRSGVTALAVAVVAASFGGGLYVGSSRTLAVVNTSFPILNGEKSKPSSVDFEPFWKAWTMLEEKYVGTGASTSTISDQDKVWGAIQGLAGAYGDPYTVFFPPEEAKEFQTEISGNFEGVGMEVGLKEGIITVIAPLKNTPAYKAGVMSGDKILKINDSITASLSVDEAVRLIRGKKGTIVTLTIIRGTSTETQEIKIVRDTISIPTLDTELRSDGIFVIRLYNFSENSAVLFRNAISEFAKSRSNKLVLDLRGNPGGYLESSVDMASWFLPKGKVVVKEDFGGKGYDSVYESKGYDVFKNTNLNMAILVDGGSASASEIFAGALREHGVAKLVGAQTFGKGSVQELVSVTKDTSLKVTVARWLTPNGVSISAEGLTPDFEVPMTAEDVKNKKDPQLEKAVGLLLGK